MKFLNGRNLSYNDRMPFGVYQGMWLGTELQRGMRDCCNGVSVLYVECGDGYLGVYISHNSAHPTAYLKLLLYVNIPQ